MMSSPDSTALSTPKRRTTWPNPAPSDVSTSPRLRIGRDGAQCRGMGSPAQTGAPSPPMPFRVPDMVPVLARGKHRRPRNGACFMELASFVAGERWSDHPSCTHPLLASLPRLVNAPTSDAGRAPLPPLAPDVTGPPSDDPRLDARIALRSAVAALPVAAT